MFLTIAAVLLLAAPVFAQGGADPTAGIGRGELTRLGALIGMGLAAGLCGTGQGKAVASAAYDQLEKRTPPPSQGAAGQLMSRRGS